MSTSNSETDEFNKNNLAHIFSKVTTAAESLKFGNINLTIHDSRIVQLDITHKERFN